MAKKIFVTGATGAVGSALIPLLLEEADNSLWLLIRAESTENLEKRLKELFLFWNLDQEQETNARHRITALQGDADLKKFALSEDIYAEIARQCTHIIHCAGVVRMNLPLQVARQHALGSAKNIVELAIACQASGTLQKVEYVSTVGVAGKMPGVVPETWITQPRSFHNTYEQSKAEAEDYLRQQIELYDLPVTIHRPSMVVGDSKTGKIIHFQIFYHICEFLAGRRTFGLLPNLSDAKLDTIPVDYVANVLKWSSDQKDSKYKIFHLCAGPREAIKLTMLCKIVRQIMRDQGFKLPIIITLPITFFNFIINTTAPYLSEKTQRAIKTFPFFLDYLADKQSFDNSITTQIIGVRSTIPSNYLVIALKKYFEARD
ncbi:SDR family oxidoreductase [Methylomonas sp. MK1]|uniref:SDR family oxidoreductase n=1 Tax=Methylomonas sp. MK1 TaxID=1131552 RepID=UPI00036BF1D6|nr:SDR family oxidoreductase [Methylomonas sp. MK1]